jgi:hypothetical protein
MNDSPVLRPPVIKLIYDLAKYYLSLDPDGAFLGLEYNRLIYIHYLTIASRIRGHLGDQNTQVR